MLLAIIVGLFLAIITISIHTLGTSLLIRYLKSHESAFQTTAGELRALVTTASALLVTHIVETVIWALAYFIAIDENQLGSFENAVYFSTVTFTTLGFGDIVIEGQWKMLAACQAMTGLLVFGWSTALLFTVVQRIWSRKLGSSVNP